MVTITQFMITIIYFHKLHKVTITKTTIGFSQIMHFYKQPLSKLIGQNYLINWSQTLFIPLYPHSTTVNSIETVVATSNRHTSTSITPPPHHLDLIHNRHHLNSTTQLPPSHNHHLQHLHLIYDHRLPSIPHKWRHYHHSIHPHVLLQKPITISQQWRPNLSWKILDKFMDVCFQELIGLI